MEKEGRKNDALKELEIAKSLDPALDAATISKSDSRSTLRRWPGGLRHPETVRCIELLPA